jgi:predicted transcriptional regulator
MNVSRPFAALMPALDSAVLSVLAGGTRPRTGREIAGVAGRSPTGVRAVLERFVEQGLVDRERAGKAFVYALNREHLAAPAIEALTNLRPGLFERLRQEIAAWKLAPVHASLFGSTARGDGDASSDIDVFVVRPGGVDEDDATWRHQLDGLAEGIRRWTGNHAGIAELSTDQLASLKRRRPPILKELDADAIALFGPDVGTLLREPADGTS